MALLDDVYAAHGGLDRWQRVERLTIDLRIGGRLLATRFQSPKTRPLRVTIDPRRSQAVLEPFPAPGQRALFDQETPRPHGLRWDADDLLYFFGYALWNYATTPFMFSLPGFVCTEGTCWREGGEDWRTLHVTFPPEIPTHCRRQTFYFDDALRLRRLDYTAEVFGSWTRGAHYVHDYRQFDGFWFPTHRVVYPRLRSGKPLRLAVMEGWIDEVRVRDTAG